MNVESRGGGMGFAKGRVRVWRLGDEWVVSWISCGKVGKVR